MNDNNKLKLRIHQVSIVIAVLFAILGVMRNNLPYAALGIVAALHTTWKLWGLKKSS